MPGPYHVDTTQQEDDEPIVPLPNYTIDEWKSEYDKLLVGFLKLGEQNKIFKTRMAEKDSLLDTTRQDYEDLNQDLKEEIEKLKIVLHDNDLCMSNLRIKIWQLKKEKEELKKEKEDNDTRIFDLEKKLTGRAEELKLVYEFLLEKNIDPEELQHLHVPIFKLFHKLRQKK